ncbi:taste receptor type 2 member 119-like [Leptodactylus fuscus]|uniref:taste receptor type 2 member 119-like n=1 Tax=Leptodactylus fuscus TaxID=238119 RepID=UPI003F4EAF00
MSSVIIWTFNSVQILACLTGFITNGFILGVNIWDQKHSAPLTTSDLYMCYLAMINLTLEIWTNAQWVCNLTEDEGFVCSLMNALKMISTTCGLLVTSSLCMFYCSRIVILKCCFFRWVQKHITRHHHYLIIGCVLLCVMLGLPLAWTGDGYEQPLCMNGSALCKKMINQYSYKNIYRSIILLFGYAIPLFYVVMSAGLILRSLIHHVKRMHKSLTMGHEIRTKAHLQAGCTVLSLLVLFVVNFVISVIFLTDVVPQQNPFFSVCYCAPMLYSVVHSLVLIKGNVKLRNAVGGLKKKLEVLK